MNMTRFETLRHTAIAVLSGVTILAAASLLSPVHAQKKVSHRFAAPAQGFVRIYNIVGTVRVTGWEHDSVAVIGTAMIGPNEGFILHRGPDGTKLGVWDESLDASKPSHLEVFVPTKSALWVKTGSADVTVINVTGSVDVSSTTGRVDIGGSPRDVVAESMGGDIYLNVNTRSARAKTAGSDIRLRGTMTDVIASTVSGNLIVESGVYDRARLESVDGDVRYFGPIGRSASLDLVNHSGTVELNIPQATWADISIDTYQGTVEQEFGALKEFNSKVKAKRYSLTLGKGGAQVNIRTFKGGIFIRRKG